jgi:TldD protein
VVARDILEEVLAKALSLGGDFSEIFVEDKVTNSIKLVNGKIDDVISGRDHGAGIRIMKGYKCVYAYTNDTSRVGLLDTAYKAACALKEGEQDTEIILTEKMPSNVHQILQVPSSVNNKKKARIVKSTYKAARDYAPEIVQVTVGYGDTDQKILIANSESLLVEDRRVRTRLFIQSVASNGKENQTGFEGPGRYMGFEMFDTIDPEYYAREASRTAVTMLHADLCPAGRMPVIIDNGFGGVIFHEACGHALEATSVAKGHSIFTGKIGEKNILESMVIGF